MRTPSALGLGLAFSLGLPCALRAQDITLDVVGGSMPGTLSLDVYPAIQPVELVIVIPSTNTGPLPISLIDPLDPRSFDVGADLLSLAFVGLTDVDGHYRYSMPIGVEPSWVDTQLHWQAATITFTPLFFDRLSNTTVFRFAAANAFRDRGVTFTNARAFSTVLPRADRKWMLVGGGQGLLLAQVATSSCETYDPITDTFVPGPNLSTPRSIHTATQLADGTWLIAGGVNASNDPQASCEIYDPFSDTFTAVTPMNVPRTGHTATLLANGKVLVTGGLLAMTVTPTQLSAIHDINNLTEIYDPTTNLWTPGPNLTTPRAGHIAVTRPDGKVLLAGGISWDSVPIIGWLPAVRRSCDLYDPVANTITPAPQMATARSLIDAVDLGSNRWLFAGGISAVTLTNPGTPTNTAEIYNAATNTWSTVGSMATARGNHKGWRLDATRFLLAGGANGSITSPTALQTTEIFSTTTNTFSAGPSMTSARAGAAAFANPSGQMQLFGGASSGGSISNSTEWYFF